MAKNTVSVLVITYNQKGFIAQWVESLRAQTTPPDEVVIVDDSSTDGTYEQLQAISKKHGYTLMRTPRNSGPSAARNIGLQSVHGDFICFLDGDDYFLPEKITVQKKALEKNPNAVLCYGDCLIDKQGTILPFNLSALMPLNEGALFDQLLSRNSMLLGGVMLRSRLAGNHRFDETLMRAEDYMYFLEISKKNDTFALVKEPVFVYRRANAGLSSQRLETIACNEEVLRRVAGWALPKPQVQLLNDQKTIILAEKVDLLLRSGGAGSLAALRELESLSPSRSRQWLLRLLHYNSFIGRMAYVLFEFYRSLRHPRKNQDELMMEQFTR
ncbi:MAG TPA: glycosyltransferase family 2 protein [Candidatus Saccharimonadia bacterium]